MHSASLNPLSLRDQLKALTGDEWWHEVDTFTLIAKLPFQNLTVIYNLKSRPYNHTAKLSLTSNAVSNGCPIAPRIGANLPPYVAPFW